MVLFLYAQSHLSLFQFGKSYSIQLFLVQKTLHPFVRLFPHRILFYSVLFEMADLNYIQYSGRHTVYLFSDLAEKQHSIISSPVFHSISQKN